MPLPRQSAHGASMSCPGRNQLHGQTTRKEKTKRKTRAPEERRREDGRNEPVPRTRDVDATAATGQPASARRSGGPTADRAHAGGGSAGTRPACRALTGAAQRRPCSEPRPAARSRSKASGASLARAAIPPRRESRGHVPSGASAPRGIPLPTTSTRTAYRW